ncbi:GcrA family cell cycle regulator [Sphingomonas japonica]|uniref:GcrA cell cycle regulator n=1 Tax=Sphingomonas japonica TaxID=511662 RepID=A0ABX0U0R4_9SPHN|nr:GcrA family cell cycle regulator [Sphingomonas japonica]NIJ22962.1 GcrA cell cycle regulator [Sphingomonas japonica]
MSWTEERIATLTRMWESGSTASQIAEDLGGISRNAVIGKAHRLGLKPRPSPVKAGTAAAPAPAAAPATKPKAAPAPPKKPVAAAAPKPEQAAPFDPAPTPPAPRPASAAVRASAPVADDIDAEPAGEVADAKPAAPAPVLRSVGPGGFLRQNPGEQAPPTTPAPPRRLVPARPSDAVAGKTSLLDLNDRICKWPIGHPGEPDFHFCGDKVNPGFPYCVDHCGHAYQAQLPRRDRRPPPPLPYGGPRVR